MAGRRRDDDLPSTAIDDASMDLSPINYTEQDDTVVSDVGSLHENRDKGHRQMSDIGTQTRGPRKVAKEKATQTHETVHTDRVATLTTNVNGEGGMSQWILKKTNWVMVALLVVIFTFGLETYRINLSIRRDIREKIISASDKLEDDMKERISSLREEIESNSDHLKDNIKAGVVSLHQEFVSSTDEIKEEIMDVLLQKEDTCYLGSNYIKQVIVCKGTVSFPVPCDPDHGGWLVFLRRYDGSVDFDLGWQEYKDGFGSLDGEFWLGLEKLHLLTSERPYQLRFNMEDFDGNKQFAVYGSFQVGPESSKYRLSVKDYNTLSTAEDSMLSEHIDGMAFTTRDKDNDRERHENCADDHGGWWYNDCPWTSDDEIHWIKFPNDEYRFFRRIQVQIKH